MKSSFRACNAQGENMKAERVKIHLAMVIALAAAAWPAGMAAKKKHAVNQGPVVMLATGGGKSFVTSPTPAIGTAEFSFSAVQHQDGTADGVFRMVRQRAGFNVDFSGIVTCMAVDPATNRAWIGGIVLTNDSDDPNHTTAIHQPGQDVWFRVVDNGEGAYGAPDRSSVYGFLGAGGVATSAEYCALKPWPDDDANAFALTEGNITVRSR
jgi:hypothetical protein